MTENLFLNIIYMYFLKCEILIKDFRLRNFERYYKIVTYNKVKTIRENKDIKKTTSKRGVYFITFFILYFIFILYSLGTI